MARAGLKYLLRQIMADYSGPEPVLPDQPRPAVIKELLALLSHADQNVRLNAAICLGIEAAALEQTEQARNIIRRLMWGLNAESGSIIWGAPEAFAQIMLRNPLLAQEYASIYMSYLEPGPNQLDQPDLLRGAIRGLQNLREAYPEIFEKHSAQFGLT